VKTAEQIGCGQVLRQQIPELALENSRRLRECERDRWA
jgi:hypothetical protein